MLQVPQTLLATWVSYPDFKELPNVLGPSKLPGWAGVTAGSVSLFMLIPLAAHVGIGALRATKLPRWGLAPPKLLLFPVIPFQLTRSITIYGNPAPSDQNYCYLR